MRRKEKGDLKNKITIAARVWMWMGKGESGGGEAQALLAPPEIFNTLETRKTWTKERPVISFITYGFVYS